MTTATALANPNIALIKYWGNRDNNFRLPTNGNISMNLDGLFTRTTVTFFSRSAWVSDPAELF
jgi:diphosphomevalonate decarboxylase